MQKRCERKVSPIPALLPHSPPNTSNVFAVLNLASVMFFPSPRNTCTHPASWVEEGAEQAGVRQCCCQGCPSASPWKNSPTHPSCTSQTKRGRGRGEQTCFRGRQFVEGQLRGRVTKPSWQLAPAGKDGAAASLSLPAPHRTASPLFPQLITRCSLSGALVFHKPLLLCEPEERKSIYWLPSHSPALPTPLLSG